MGRQPDSLAAHGRLEHSDSSLTIKYHWINIKPAGASLLAIAGCQSTSTLNDTPLSRAGSLLQGIVPGLKRVWRRSLLP
ncbi:hypothetical protein C1X34_31045 [Pseudomonas sp. GW456-12-10-14-TSB6]|nr:hypothetical protein C1X56_28300 [Pseudomonas sp. GW101-1A09]PMV92591.1 hypothetical protein C1X55_28580 [Pseudomonas sp. GW460-C8]PMV99530.1 hypothetical protein C1X50_29985 [Pseudomonas sp. MPR-TSA4]PMW09937.1 hypothetical protein C1X52_24140 [Pseudomonas sp. FW306-2-1A-C05A]PMW11295.1 hypothetical protein C1X40_28650 [Pseudomonas sp. GW456-11-11-14-TSB2]PMW13379.1 hypothetical protein C1X53_29630 [Pseudomonas sp. GW456-E6]PMW28028.1 hypothetical protein C1X45_31860 [Pseudomonas sp. GW46